MLELSDPVTAQDINSEMSRAERVDILKERSNISQRNFKQAVKNIEAIEIRGTYWVNNKVSVESGYSSEELEELPFVENARLSTTFEHPGLGDSFEKEDDKDFSTASTATSSNDYDTTYGLDQINASKVWEEYDSKGEDVRVAVLDTGIDTEHPDLEIMEDGFKDFIDGEDEPYDPDGHGTHVSGTVFGGDESGEWIGVAPNVEGMHGRVCGDENEGCPDEAIQEGIDWAVENNADIVSMSIGAPENYECSLGTENILDAGALPVAASGNDKDGGYGSSSSPGNRYDVLGVGASNEDKEIAEFSMGEELERTDFSACDNEDWPDTFMAPQVSAPGVGVLSSIPETCEDGICYKYGSSDGTSMAAPHVAGAAALIQSVTVDEMGPWEIRDVLEETAVKPSEDEWEDFIEEETDNEWNGDYEEPDPRYGSGIIDVYGALQSIEDFENLNSCERLENGNYRLNQSFEGEKNCLELDNAVIDGNNNTLKGIEGRAINASESRIQDLKLSGWDKDLEVEGFTEVSNLKIEDQLISVNGSGFELGRNEEPETLPEEHTNVSDYLSIEGEGYTELSMQFNTSKDSSVSIWRHDEEWQKEDSEIEGDTAYGNFSDFSTFTVARELEPADFQILDVEADPITEGQEIEVVAEIGNQGELEAEQRINLKQGGDVLDSEELKLEEDETEKTEFSKEINDSETEELKVSTENDTKKFDVEVYEKPELEDLVPDGETFGVNESEITFEADLDAEEEAEIKLFVENEEEDSENFTDSIEFSEDFNEGKYEWRLEYKGLETGYQKVSEDKNFEIEESAHIDLGIPEEDEKFDPGTQETDFEFNLISETSGNVELFLNEEKKLDENHEEGEENYSETLDVNEGPNYWYVVFESDTGNKFESENESFNVEEIDIEAELQEPDSDTVFDFPERNVTFQYGVETNIDTQVDLVIDESTEDSEVVSSDSEEELESHVELNPGEAEWYIRAESVDTDHKEETSTRTLEVEEPVIDHQIDDPSNDTFFEWDDRTVDFNYQVLTEDNADTKIILDEEQLHSEEVSSSDSYQNVNSTANLNPGNHTWHVETETDYNKETSETQELEVEEPELDLELSKREEEYRYPDRELTFEFSVFSNETGDVTAYIDEEEEKDEEFDTSEDFSFEKELDPGKYNWTVEAETDTGKEKNKTSSFTIKEPELSIDGLSPEDGEKRTFSGEVFFQADIFSETDTETEFILENDTETEVFNDEVVKEEEFNISKELDPGKYNWTFNASNDFKQREKTQEFTLEERVEFSNISPGSETFDYDVEEVELGFRLETGFEGYTELYFDDSLELNESHEDVSEYSTVVDVDEDESYEWEIKFVSETGEEFTETHNFDVEEQEDDDSEESESSGGPPPMEPEPLCEEPEYSFDQTVLEFCIPEDEELETSEIKSIEKLVLHYPDEIDSDLKLESFEPESDELVFEEGFKVDTNDSVTADIYFDIEQEWLEDKGLKEENISLYKEEGGWKDLDTEKESGMFVSQNVSFSEFGYGGEKQEEVDVVTSGECRTYSSKHYTPEDGTLVDSCDEWSQEKEQVESRISDVEASQEDEGIEEATELIEKGEIDEAESIISEIEESREKEQSQRDNTILIIFGTTALIIIVATSLLLHNNRKQSDQEETLEDKLDFYLKEMRTRLEYGENVEEDVVEALDKAVEASKKGREQDARRYLDYLERRTDL